jgi:hypothetical protein
MCFFDSIDTNEALAHEMALHHLSRDNRGDVAVGRASWRRLAFRKLVGDPFDLSRRPLMVRSELLQSAAVRVRAWFCTSGMAAE